MIRAATGSALPVVSLTATDAAAAEAGANPGTFTFTRRGGTAAGLTVSYTRSGSATAGTDFTPSLPAAGSVSFSPGQASATVTITPATDGLAEGTETVILTLTPGAGYDVGAPATASVTITDADSEGDLINGAMLTGAISTAGEVDTWMFHANAGDRITVHIGEITDSNDFRPWIRLRAPRSVTPRAPWRTSSTTSSRP